MQTNVSKTCSGPGRKTALSRTAQTWVIPSDFLNGSYRKGTYTRVIIWLAEKLQRHTYLKKTTGGYVV